MERFMLVVETIQDSIASGIMLNPVISNPAADGFLIAQIDRTESAQVGIGDAIHGICFAAKITRHASLKVLYAME